MSSTVEIFGELIHETEMAWFVEVDEDEPRVWLPKSKCAYDGKTTFTIPEWLAIEKGLV